MPRTRTGPQADSAARTALPIRSTARLTRRFGWISVCPRASVCHGVGCSAYGRPGRDADATTNRATALDEVVPMSRPTTMLEVMDVAPRSRVR